MRNKQRLNCARQRQVLVFALLLAFLACSFLAAEVSAQPTISLSLNKVEGYNLGSDIGGQFSLNTKTSNDVMRVEFYLNGTLESTDNAAPFSWTFNTDDYLLGHANITAVAYDSSGRWASSSLTENFVKSPNIWIIILPVAVILPVIIAVAYVLQSRRNAGKSRLVKCPTCGNVYTPSAGLSLVHVGSSQLRRCPRCGKTFFGGNLTEPTKEETPPTQDNLTEDERLRQDIEKSKYEDRA